MHRALHRVVFLAAAAALQVDAADLRQSGAKCDGRSDDLPAFLAAIEALPEGGGVIEIPAGTCRLSGTLNLTKPLRITGAVSSSTNAGAPGPGSILLIDAGRTGIVVNRHNTLDDKAVADHTFRGADDSIIENVLVKSAGGREPAHGIWLRARATLRNVNVDGFSGNGVRILATAKGNGATQGNANNWRMDKVRITRSGSDGLFVDGSDVNAGVAVEVDSSGNGGWGIFDSGFLGNTYIGAHAESNRSGAYKTDNPNARHLFIGCYSEGGQPPSSLAFPTLVVGGLHGAGFTAESTHGNLGAGGWLARRGFEFAARGDGASQAMTTTIHGLPNEVIASRALGDHAQGFQFLYNQGAYEWRNGSLDSRRAQVYTTELNDGRVQKIVVQAAGSGYTRADVRISGGGGEGAEAVAVISGGRLASISVKKSGAGYTSAPSVIIEGDGSGAAATASVTRRIMAGRNEPLPPAQSIFPQGLFLGAANNTADARLQSNGAEMPTKGEYAKGDFVWRRNPVEAGAAGAKFILLGWVRLTTGNTHVPNVDWAEARVLTGN